MTQKIIFLIIFLLGITGIVGCRVPILNKEVNIFFWKKTPEEIINSMQSQMILAKTFKEQGNFSVKITFNNTDLKSSFSPFLKNKKEKTDFSVPSKEAGSLEKLTLDSSFKPNQESSLSDKHFFEGGSRFENGPVEAMINFDFQKIIDKQEKNNFKDELNLNIGIDFKGNELKVAGKTKNIGNTFYFKLEKVPFPFSLFLEKFLNQWFEVDFNELKDVSKDAFPESSKIKKYDFNNREKNRRIQEKIENLLVNGKILNFKEKLKDEKINNKECYHYQVTLNKENLRLLLKEVLEIMNEEYEEEFFYNTEFKSFLGQLPKTIIQDEIELWIDKKDFYLRKVGFYFVIDLSKAEIGGEKIPENALKIEITGEEEYFDFNQPVEIKKPNQVKNLIKEIEKNFKFGFQNKSSSDHLFDKDPCYGLTKEDYKNCQQLLNSSKNKSQIKIDSDKDGLNDEEEIIWGTDILNPDTDGDGYLDGQEVRNGYNPNGPGKLNKDIYGN